MSAEVVRGSGLVYTHIAAAPGEVEIVQEKGMAAAEGMAAVDRAAVDKAAGGRVAAGLCFVGGFAAAAVGCLGP